jgi:hypothetical protein
MFVSSGLQPDPTSFETWRRITQIRLASFAMREPSATMMPMSLLFTEPWNEFWSLRI